MECFHMTSRRPYWCPKTMKRRPCWCPKPILRELNSFLMQTPSFVPINLHRRWPREWKRSIAHPSGEPQLSKFGYLSIRKIWVGRWPYVRPFVRTRGQPMWNLTHMAGVRTYNLIMHIHVVINTQLSKTGYPLISITWPYRGLRCQPIEVANFFFSYPPISHLLSANCRLNFMQIYFQYMSLQVYCLK